MSSHRRAPPDGVVDAFQTDRMSSLNCQRCSVTLAHFVISALHVAKQRELREDELYMSGEYS